MATNIAPRLGAPLELGEDGGGRRYFLDRQRVSNGDVGEAATAEGTWISWRTAAVAQERAGGRPGVCRERSVILMLILTSNALAAEPPTTAAIKALQALNQSVSWDAKSAVIADVTCDGRPDTVVLGYEPDVVWLGVVPRRRWRRSAEPTTTRLLVGKETQNSLCALPVRIEIGPIDCEYEGGSLPGCEEVEGCSDFSLVDDHCDSFHFYWDATEKSITWWRR